MSLIKLFDAFTLDNQGSSSSLHESKNSYEVKDFPINSLITFKDGEVWKAVKSDLRKKADEITIKPFNKLAKDKNVSLAIDVSLKYLNDNVTAIVTESDVQESPNDSELSEGTFYRISKDVIQSDLFLASKNLTALYEYVSAGNDIEPGVLDSIIKKLNTVKKDIKKFNSAEEVKGTIYEGLLSKKPLSL